MIGCTFSTNRDESNQNENAVPVSVAGEGIDVEDHAVYRIVIEMEHDTEVRAGPAYGAPGVHRDGQPIIYEDRT
jgi:hypothetical protein